MHLIKVLGFGLGFGLRIGLDLEILEILEILEGKKNF
jgi:hypothetical protein